MIKVWLCDEAFGRLTSLTMVPVDELDAATQKRELTLLVAINADASLMWTLHGRKILAERAHQVGLSSSAIQSKKQLLELQRRWGRTQEAKYYEILDHERRYAGSLKDRKIAEAFWQMCQGDPDSALQLLNAAVAIPELSVVKVGLA